MARRYEVVRQQIVDRLDHSYEASPSQLARTLGLPVATVAYHVNVLVDRGVLVATRETQRRGAVMHFYAMHAEGPAERLAPRSEWLWCQEDHKWLRAVKSGPKPRRCPRHSG